MIGYFEDIEIGAQTALGSHTFTQEEIISFAERFDPQLFHLDEEAAKSSLFGGLCASGWHTGCVWLRLLMVSRKNGLEELRTAGKPVPRFGPSPGARDLRWLRPVYPGDVISYRATVVEKKDSKSRPDYGLVASRHEGVNQDGEIVISLQGSVLVERRETRSLADE